MNVRNDSDYVMSALQAIGAAVALTLAVMFGFLAYQSAIEVSSLREVVDRQGEQIDRITARASTHTKTTDRLID